MCPVAAAISIFGCRQSIAPQSVFVVRGISSNTPRPEAGFQIVQEPRRPQEGKGGHPRRESGQSLPAF
ncbi:MAG: hypothetical protein JWM59_4104 [Verrucomicrobiales bacterium]|nr:hypothetical protein [Verrucomicrobiales bacterium]